MKQCGRGMQDTSKGKYPKASAPKKPRNRDGRRPRITQQRRTIQMVQMMVEEGGVSCNG